MTSRQVLEHIRKDLPEKRRNVTEWLATSPAEEKELCLSCASEQDVDQHLQVIDHALGQAEDETLGICKVCHGEVNARLLEMDYTASVCLDCLSEEERRQLETELELSQAVHRAILPQEPPEIPGLDIAAFSRPAQIVGGDYFDFIPLEDGSYALAIADAMGHGLSAGMVMASLQATLRMILPESQSPDLALERINRFYLHNINFTTFVTLFLGIYDPHTHLMTYFNAGHNPPALFRKKTRELQWLQPTGAAIGVVEEYHVRSTRILLEEGDVLVFYTDGITEAYNSTTKQTFGRQRLEGIVLEHANDQPVELVTSLREELTDFMGDQPIADDVTFVTSKVTE